MLPAWPGRRRAPASRGRGGAGNARIGWRAGGPRPSTYDCRNGPPSRPKCRAPTSGRGRPRRACPIATARWPAAAAPCRATAAPATMAAGYGAAAPRRPVAPPLPRNAASKPPAGGANGPEDTAPPRRPPPIRTRPGTAPGTGSENTWRPAPDIRFTRLARHAEWWSRPFRLVVPAHAPTLPKLKHAQPSHAIPRARISSPNTTSSSG